MLLRSTAPTISKNGLFARRRPPIFKLLLPMPPWSGVGKLYYPASTHRRTNMTHPINEDEELEVALAALDQPEPPPVEQRASITAATASDSPVSPTLAALEQHRRPKFATACEICPLSLWFASPAEVKCYCRAMYHITWSSKEPNQITACDGTFLGQDQ
jgi:hypothetical protein